MQMAVVMPTTVTAQTDGFIDDLIQVFLDTPKNKEQALHSVPLAIHLTSRPHAGLAEPIQQQGLLSNLKLIAEGTPEESQIVLGWKMDARHLLLLLPTNNFDTWLHDIVTMSTNGKPPLATWRLP
jgi:hypothetical protein